MIFQNLLLRITIFALFTVSTFQHQCIHDKLETDIQINHPSNSLYSTPEGRVLQSYQNINILFDASTFDGVTDSFKQYIIESLLPPVQNIIQAALKVKSRSAKLRVGNVNTICTGSVAVPTLYKTQGVDADLVIFLKAQYDAAQSYVASATSCLLDSTTQRPVIGKITYNLNQVAATTNDVRREKDILVTLHELTHVLGFSTNLYKYYINPITNKPLSGHYYSKTVMGFTTTVLNLNALTTRLRNHFNCPTLEGAYLENQGGVQSAGSHFERRVLYNDYMTASAIIDTRLTEFTLALLEGTGWYIPNYEMADPITWGKNKGCAFVEEACMNKATQQPNFKEFCSPLVTKTCSWTRRAGGSCGAYQLQKDNSLSPMIDWWGDKTVGQDTFSDNCPIVLPYDNIDCENSDNQATATLSSEFYGYGSKCFMGTLHPRGPLGSSYPYCLKSTCKKNSNGGYYVELKLDSQTANCYSQGQIQIPGYGGALSCPDPAEFCGQVMTEGFCRRGCSGRGSCVNKECVCKEGWGGFDCSKPTYQDKCQRCANSDPLKASCYGDICGCNPTNTTCMCPAGTENIAQCIQMVVDYTNSLLHPSKTAYTVAPIQSKRRISSEALIAIICGSIGGLIVLVGIFLGIRYARKRLQAKKVAKDLRPRPPKLDIHFQKALPRDFVASSNPDSAQLSLKGLTLQSYNDSPLISQYTPYTAKTAAPSIFKNYTPKVHPQGKINEELELQAIPDSTQKVLDLEDPQVIRVTELELDTPQQVKPIVFEDKIESDVVPDV